MKIDLHKLETEQQNSKTRHIDKLTTHEMVQLINREDQSVIDAIQAETKAIADAIDVIYFAIKNGGRLVYIGAGTSGRLGILDASECLPTFGVSEEMVIGLIAGGDRALRYPVEAAEDNESAAIEDLKAIKFNCRDILCAITSSGRTPYCISGIHYAKSLGAKTISLACVNNSDVGKLADYKIETVVGQEVITGSTRMKSGSAQKMVLNMLSTGVMIKLGKVFGNLMVDVKATNNKLVERARQMIINVTNCSYSQSTELLTKSNGHVKTAIIMALLHVSKIEAEQVLVESEGRIHIALDKYRGDE